MDLDFAKEESIVVVRRKIIYRHLKMLGCTDYEPSEPFYLAKYEFV